MRILAVLVLLLAGFAALTLWRAARNEAAAERAYPPSGQFIEVDGQRVHALVQGEGPDLVLIHGSSGNLRDFTYDMVGPLSERYRVIAFDRPGLGYSDPISPEGASLSEQAAVLVAAARQLGAERPIVLGQSLGGAVALAWAVEHPDSLSALVTVSGVAYPWDTGLGLYYTVLASWPGRTFVIPLITAWISEAQIEGAIADVYAPLPMPEGYADHLGPRMIVRRGPLRANALQRRGLLDWVTAQAPRYGDISVPVEIVHGREDTTVAYRIHAIPLSEAVPGANLTTLETPSHMPHHTHFDTVIDAIDRAAARAGLR